MNTIWIVMPILIVLMFLMGLDIDKKAFTDIAHNPKAVLLGMIGQLVFLPILAFSIAWLLKLPPVYFMGLVLVACCPGGSSSNVFSMLAKGDVALSVTLSAGSLFKSVFPEAAIKVRKFLGRMAFPALMILAVVFFLQYRKEIADNFASLGLSSALLIVCAMACSSFIARTGKFSDAVRRTIVIEVGMQNAAQAITIASSPFIFNSGEMALPAICYALLMNVILLTYVYCIRQKQK